MPNFEITLYPNLGADIMPLVRSIVNDTFAGVGGTQGRIFTNDAPFTLPYLNEAIAYVLRELRNEGVTFPIRDGVVLYNIPPVVTPNPDVFINVGFTGTYNGQTTSANPRLPGDCMQVFDVRQRVHGTGNPFTLMKEAQSGLASGFQNQWLGLWEWRQMAIWMNGSTQAQDIMIRYQSGQPPLNVPAADFGATPIYIIDSTDAIANRMAWNYGKSRGAIPQVIADTLKACDDAIDGMALAYIRRAQRVSYRRESYQGGGSNNSETYTTGATGVFD